MKSINKELESLIAEYAIVHRAGKRRPLLLERISQERDRLEILKVEVQKEYDDIVAIEETSLRNVFNTILKNPEEQIEKERQEYLQKVLEYRECKKLIDLLKYELDILSKVVRDEETILNQIDAVIASATLDNQDSGLIIQYQFLSMRIREISLMLKEIDEAYGVGNKILDQFSAMRKSLDKSRSLGSWGEFYHEVQIRKAVQKSHLDDAESYAMIAKKLMMLFKSEIDDVVNFDSTHLDKRTITSQLTNKFYSTLIDDWIGRTNLASSISFVQDTTQFITSLNKSLNTITRQLKEDQDRLEIQRNGLLLGD